MTPAAPLRSDGAYAALRRGMTAVGPKVVTAAHPLAASAALGALERGGNAFDAVVAACLMETIALPMKCGLAGDLVALFRRGEGPFEALVSIGGGARAIADGATLARTGPGSIGVPGAPHGYSLLAGMGRLPLGMLAEPAIQAAHLGVPWRDVELGYLREGQALLARYSPDNPYLRDGELPAEGSLRMLPELGGLLEQFVEHRANLFHGPLGTDIARHVAALGGILTAEDFLQKPGRIAPPLATRLPGGAQLLTTPYPTTGPQLADALASLGPRPRVATPDIIETMRQKTRLKGRAARDGGTSVVGCADDDGNVAIVLHSNSFPQFASGVVLPSGLILNNRPGRGFDLDAPAGSPAAPGAGKTPPTTLHAWSLTEGARSLIGATPGGVNQLPWNFQVLGRLLAGETVEDAVLAPRWALDAAGRLSAEPGADTGARRYDTEAEPFGLRSVMQVIAPAANGAGHKAVADPRTGALALAGF